MALVDTTGITKIGEVERGSLIPEGTPVYEIPGYPEHDVVAVKTDRNNAGLVTNIFGYLVYVLHAEDGKSHYPKVQDQQVKQIKIFSGSKLLQELKEEDVSFFLFYSTSKEPTMNFNLKRDQNTLFCL